MEIVNKWLMDELEEGLYIVNMDREIVFWNKGAEKISGFKASEVVGRTCHDNVLNHIDEKGYLLCLEGCPLIKAINQEEPYVFRAFVQHKEGYRIPVEIKTFPYIENGERTGIVEVFNVDYRYEMNEAYQNPQDKNLFIDHLTKVYSREYVDYVVNQYMEEYQNLKTSFGIIIVDVDSFEDINQIYGEQVCDQMLAMLAKTYRHCFRDAELLGRFKQDEFIFIYQGITHDGLDKTSEFIRMISESTALRNATFKEVDVTVSVGGTLVHQQDTVEAVIKRAYSNMKKSKQKGGNIVTIK